MQPGALADDLIQLCSARLDLIIDQLYGKLILLGQLLPGSGKTFLNAFLSLGAAAAQAMLLCLLLHLPQSLAELEGEEDGRTGDGNGVRHRFGGIHRHGLVRHQAGHQIDQRQ